MAKGNKIIRTSNNLIPWFLRQKSKMFSKMIYPGFKLSLRGIADWYLFSLFVIPNYFGIRMAFFDLTAFRFFEILLLICIWQNKERRDALTSLVLRSRHTFFILMYMTVVVYTNLIHPSLGTIFYWLMNGSLAFYLITYLIVEIYGIEDFLDKIRGYCYILTILSPLELILKKSPFVILDTLHKAGAQKARFGSMRILGNATTANGFAMFLCILVPIVLFDYRKKRVDFIKNIWLLLLLILNIFLTGSRLTVGIVILELGLCFFLQSRKVLLRTTTILMIALPLLIAFCYVFQNVSFVQGLLRTFFTAFDEVFKTSISLKYGADAEILYNSSRYRELLYEKTILDTWLNPLLGRGGNYYFHVYTEGYNIESIDNFYVGQYITYAWPGLITWIAMSFTFLWSSLRRWMKKKDSLSWLLAVSIICYFISLWYLDQLQTFPIMFTVFSMVNALEMLDGKKKLRNNR